MQKDKHTIQRHKPTYGLSLSLPYLLSHFLTHNLTQKKKQKNTLSHKQSSLHRHAKKQRKIIGKAKGEKHT